MCILESNKVCLERNSKYELASNVYITDMVRENDFKEVVAQRWRFNFRFKLL